MRNMWSRRGWEGELPRIRLDSVWYVDADASYDISKRGAIGQGYVAARTLTGAGIMELSDGQSLVLDANSVLILKNRNILRYASLGDNWQFYWFEYSAPDGYLNGNADLFHIRASSQERIELDRCFMSLSRGSMHECMLAESLFTYLLNDWLTRSGQTGASEQQIIALLEMGRRERLSIPELARRAGMCERSFRSAVQQATGLSPKAYILKGEMAAAMELLRTTGMSVSEIAASLDYKSSFYFSRVFKNYFGISPQHVREDIQL